MYKNISCLFDVYKNNNNNNNNIPFIVREEHISFHVTQNLEVVLDFSYHSASEFPVQYDISGHVVFNFIRTTIVNMFERSPAEISSSFLIGKAAGVRASEVIVFHCVICRSSITYDPTLSLVSAVSISISQNDIEFELLVFALGGVFEGRSKPLNEWMNEWMYLIKEPNTWEKFYANYKKYTQEN